MANAKPSVAEKHLALVIHVPIIIGLNRLVRANTCRQFDKCTYYRRALHETLTNNTSSDRDPDVISCTSDGDLAATWFGLAVCWQYDLAATCQCMQRGLGKWAWWASWWASCLQLQADH